MAAVTDLELGEVAAAEVGAAALVLARALQSNPTTVSAYLTDAGRRTRVLERLFRALLRARGQPALCARWDGAIVGVAGFDAVGECQRLSAADLRVLVPALARVGPRAARATVRIMMAWEKQDPDLPHNHLGPVAVDPDMQHQGIGSRLMEAYCARLETAGEASYLETDKPENVVFYRRFGYGVIAEAEVVGAESWFMLREAA